MFSSAFVCLFVCLKDYAKSIQPIFTKFSGKVAQEETITF